MLRNRRVSKVLSLIIVMIMVLGSFTSIVSAQENKINSARVDLEEKASMKIEADVKDDLEKEGQAEVLVYMEDQVDTKMIAKATKSAVSEKMTPYNTRLEVRKGVVEALKDKADSTQTNLLNYLEQEKEKGNVEEFKSYHLVNIVYVKATEEVIENISYMTEVGKIYKNNTYQMDISITDRDVRLTSKDIQQASTEPEWNITRVGADQSWDLGVDGAGIVVGSLDSGVDWTHPALHDKWRGYDPNTGETDPSKSWFDPVYGANLPEDSDSHGTHVMGTMVGQEPDGSNPVGVAPGAKWITARVFNTAGSTTDKILLDAAEWMLHPGGDSTAAPDAVNNSWGGLDGIDDWYRDAVINWRSAEIFPVFSAGNQRPGEPEPWPGSISCPANYPESFAVAAVNRNDERASFSKLGPSPYDETLIKPNISAPGVNIYSCIPGGYTSGYSGTSMSAPHVTGTVALLLSANASLALEDIEQILSETADPLTDDEYPESPNFGYGYGMVNAFEAVSQVASGTGIIEGKVLKEGEDLEDLVIEHEQEITEVYAGSEIEIEARITDDVSVVEAELLVKPEGKSYWFLVPMDRISGDHKDGIYTGTITHDMLLGDGLVYKIRARDYAGEAVVTQDYNIDINFGVVPDEYTQGFEDNALGWTMEGDWEWGPAVADFDPVPYEGENLAGTVLGANHSNSADDWMITPPIDLRDDTLEAATLRFNHWLNTYHDYDYGTVLVTNDYGETWTQIGPEYTGDLSNWQEVVVNLEDYIGSTNPVFVAFRFISNSYTQREGWYIDNVRLVGVDTEAPAAPLDLNAEANIRGIKLTWEPSSEGDLDHYNVYRAETAGGPYTLVSEVATNKFVDMEAPHDVEQFYVVTAVDFSANESSYSNESSAVAVPYTELFGTDFEKDNGEFVTGVTEGTANDWEWGIPTSGPNAAASGEKLWATNLDGDYTGNNNSYIESPAIEIPEDNDVVLTFTHWYDFEGTSTLWDYGQVMISNDDGETWVNITPTEEGKYGSRIQEWFTEEISLNEYAGDTIKIRFFFHSDGIIYYSGWYVDDVYVMAAAQEEEPEINPESEHGIELEPNPEELARREDYVEPAEPSYKIERSKVETDNYETVSDEEVANTPLARGTGIPVEEGVITVLETGRSVKTDPATGEYSMRVPKGDYTLRAEAYGYYAEDVEVSVDEDEIVSETFILDPKPRGTITGTVFDRYYGDPASNALITVVEDPKVEPVVADEDGNFTIPDIIVGTYTLKVVADGFEPGEFTVEVEDEGVTEVELGLKRFVGYEEEIIYDDGTAENALVLNEAPNGLAVRFTPDEYGKVKGTNIYLWGTDWPSPGGNRLGFTIYDIDENGNPVQVGDPIFIDDLVRGDWNYIDLSSFGFSTEDDFYISTIQDKPGTSCPGTGIDEASEYADRSYMNIDGEFQLISSEGIVGGLMIRAVMEYSVSTPEITNLEEINYTNQDSITVEGTVTADGKVNVYVNGEKVTSIDSENKMFTAEVELPEAENTIMVTAEMDGVETEPCPEVTVIKDQVLPTLEVERPLDNAKINEEVVHVEGNVTDDIGLSQLLINEKEAEVDEEGNFHERLIVNEGENLITVSAIDLAGNETIVERTVSVELGEPTITNILPDEDVELTAGDELEISFNAPTGGSGYYRILLPFGSSGDDLGTPMPETDGVYSATWTVPEGLVAADLQIQVIYVSEHGTKVSEIAPGRVTIVDDEDEETAITNIQPENDVELTAGDTLDISFNAPTSGEGYYRILLPFEMADNNGIPMTEISEGLYAETWTVPTGLIAADMQVEVVFIDSDGTRVSEIADGRVTVIEDTNNIQLM
ncbi:S8 family serine peptidase [Schnuerera sp. xch1]|uniref:S8 family serine peptidase n=1 Tax=Schnuerera sp. xch1 TaxID=2874283 RepID=UPI001CC1B748|nr:S8 family serine peptidase [Schnuerera sp. xch1]MBZ2175131.1 S8 family serine peptidase [Schnuerera sp. xch1]